MADKRVVIGVGSGTDKLSLSFLRVTKAEVEEELDSDITKTFDEPVTTPSSEGGYSVTINALEARSLSDFKTLKKILKRMKEESGTISIYETVKHKEGNFESEAHTGGVKLSSNKVTYDAEDLTARDLEFKAESLREVVDGEEI